jgi:hypothetical protein
MRTQHLSSFALPPPSYEDEARRPSSDPDTLMLEFPAFKTQRISSYSSAIVQFAGFCYIPTTWTNTPSLEGVNSHFIAKGMGT